jgi:hypothetical protein
VPVVSPVTVIGEDEPVAVMPPGLEVTVYPVITAGTPGLAGAVNVSEAVVEVDDVAVPIVGAPGTCACTELEAALAGPVPLALDAVTVKVYAVPKVSPVTVIGEDEPVAVIPPGFEVTVKLVIIAGMPGLAGAVNVTDADVPETILAVPIVGAPGGTPPRVDSAVEARKPIPKPLRTGMPKLI